MLDGRKEGKIAKVDFDPMWHQIIMKFTCLSIFLYLCVIVFERDSFETLPFKQLWRIINYISSILFVNNDHFSVYYFRFLIRKKCCCCKGSLLKTLECKRYFLLDRFSNIFRTFFEPFLFRLECKRLFAESTFRFRIVFVGWSNRLSENSSNR